MDVFEEIVMNYLVRNGDTFVSPQFNVKSMQDKVWSCPDFVALNVPKKVVSVVEVSVKSGIKGLVQRVNDRNNHWIEKLRNQLIHNHVVDERWTYQVHVFIRKDQIEYFERNVADREGVIVEVIEDVCFSWSPTWWEKKLDQSQTNLQ